MIIIQEAKEAPITYLDDNDAIFYVENEGDYQVKKEDALKALIRRWPENNLRGKISDQIWTTQLCNYLNELADKRISHVQSWIKDNLSQFQASDTVIEELRRALETKTIEIKRGISICKVQCEDCHLLCLHPPFHSGRHDCETDHTCHSPCQFFEEHYERRSCGLQYVPVLSYFRKKLLMSFIAEPDMKGNICEQKHSMKVPKLTIYNVQLRSINASMWEGMCT